MNAFVGERLSIITSKAQTTRHRILGIVNGDDFQMILSDTPGIIKPAYQLQESMMDFVKSAFEDAEVALRSAEASLRSSRGVAAQRQAEVERIALEIRLANIVAPYDGIITSINANVGAAVTQRNPDLVEMLDLSRVEIEISVPTAKLALFTVGKTVKFDTDTGSQGQAKVRTIMSVLAKNKRDRVIRMTLVAPGQLKTIHDQEGVTVSVGE